jgi:hypothetical protein
MPNLTITSATKTGNTVVVTGTATTHVTCTLVVDGQDVATQGADPDPNSAGQWSVTFNNVPNGMSYSVRASSQDGKTGDKVVSIITGPPGHP